MSSLTVHHFLKKEMDREGCSIPSVLLTQVNLDIDLSIHPQSFMALILSDVSRCITAHNPNLMCLLQIVTILNHKES